MFKILEKEWLNVNTFKMILDAPMVAHSCLPGQFVIVRDTEDGERIPLTICDYDREKKTITIVVQTIGGSTLQMSKREAGEYLADVVGPLGHPSDLVTDDIEDVKKKKIIFVAGGLGTAPVYCQVKWLHEHGITADVIVGPIGIIAADSMLGEITPKMAEAIGQSNAKKVLIPVSKCFEVAGVQDMPLSQYVTEAVHIILG